MTKTKHFCLKTQTTSKIDVKINTARHRQRGEMHPYIYIFIHLAQNWPHSMQMSYTKKQSNTETLALTATIMSILESWCKRTDGFSLSWINSLPEVLWNAPAPHWSGPLARVYH